jgi:hypothetical protein
VDVEIAKAAKAKLNVPEKEVFLTRRQAWLFAGGRFLYTFAEAGPVNHDARSDLPRLLVGPLRLEA